ncbi:MAG: glycosyltransferase, partial [Kosmotogaceae bacterium]
PNVERLKPKRRTSSDDIVRFVYSGSIDIDRSIVEMIQAFRLVRKTHNVELDLLGPIFDPELKRLILDSENNGDGLHYKGFLPYEEALDSVAQNDIGLMVVHRGRSKEMSSPLKMFEYLGLGLPIIASDFKKWHEVLDEKPCALFVDPDSAEDIAEKMEILIKDKKLRNQMRDNAIEISRKYTWKSIKDRLLTLYRSL